jgi:hypothetical protein
MATIEIKSQLTTDELLNAAKQLPTVELKQFIARLISNKTQATVLSEDEANLLQIINQPLPAVERYSVLATKRDAETLTDAEYVELLTLTEQHEAYNVKRMKALADLAHLRGKSLSDIMQELGIQR